MIDIESFATRGKSFSDFINLLGGLLDPGIIMGAESSASPLIFVFTHVNKRKFRTVSAILSHIDQIKTERSAEMRVMVQSLMPSLQVIANKLNRTDELLAVLETTQAFAQSPEDASQAYPVFFTLVKGLLEAYKSALQENDADYCRAQKHYTELSDAYYELIALSIILKYKDSPRNHFIIDGEVGDDRQILLDHIQRLSECAPIDKANFVFQGRAGEEWLQLDKLLQETAEKAAALKQTLEECPKEVVAIKKYHGFLKAQHKEHMAILNMLQTNQESNIEDISNELTARDAMLMQYLGRELEDRRTRQEELQTELEVLDTAEPMRHLHPALGPFDFSVSELRRWASFGMGCLADSVFLAPLLATTVVGSIAGRLAVLINEIIGDSDSEVIMRAAMMPALMLVSPRYFFLEKMLGIAHDFVYHDLPFVKAELHPNSVVEKYPEHPGLRGRDTFAWMTRGNCRNAFYSDTIVEDKEKGIFKISGYFDNSDVHIKLYVEKRIHPDIKPRIELLRQQLERLQYATSQYFQAHTNEHEAEHEALIACSVAVDKKSALIDFLGRSIARYQTRISQLNGYLYEYKSSIRNAEHEWHAHVVSCLETLDMVYEVVGSQREFVKNLLTEAKEFSTQSALQAVTHPLTIWGRKATPEQAIEYQLKGKKEAGSSIGATYHPADKPDATWIGKLGLRELTDEEMPGIQGTQVYHGRAIEALKEKIASDFYILLSEGTYGVPKTRLAEIPLESLRSAYGARDYYELITAPLNHQRVDNYVTRGVFLMSKYWPDYHDLHNLENCIIEGKKIRFLDCLKAGKLPEFVDVEGKNIPIRGLMALLATARLLGDSDVLGVGGKNAGFVIEKDIRHRPICVRIVKIDPGFAFDFTESNLFYRGAIPGDREPLKRDGRNIQYAGNDGCILPWAGLTDVQKRTYIQTLHCGFHRLRDADFLDLVLTQKGFRATPSGKTLRFVEIFTQRISESLRHYLDVQETFFTKELGQCLQAQLKHSLARLAGQYGLHTRPQAAQDADVMYATNRCGG